MEKPMKKSEKQKIVIFAAIFIFASALVISLLLINPKTLSEQTTNVNSLQMQEEYSIINQEANYFENYKGYLAKPSDEGIYPGIIMIHEWWGLNENIKEMADKLATQGYIVLAVDMYGEVTSDSNRARELATSVRNNSENAIENLRAAKNYLEENGASTIGSLGWCFGGQQSLQISLNEPLDATVIYYGNLVTDKSELEKLNGPVLGIFGSTDTSIPVETVNEFDAVLDEVGVDNQINIYDGVGHAFANPSGANYAPQETLDAWEKTLAFLDQNLKN